MKQPSPAPGSRQQWRRLGILFLSLLPLMALFHLVMWFGFTRTLFRAQTGDLKRLGYLVGLEDCKATLVAAEPPLPPLPPGTPAQAPVVIFGDSFSSSLAKAYRLQTGTPVQTVAVNWAQSGLVQVKRWLNEAHFSESGVKTIVIERVEYAWLNTFADEGDPARTISWQTQASGQAPALYEKAPRWTFANNGNFKVLICNLGFYFSPTAFSESDTWIARLKKNFFNCSYGDRLLFYRGESEGALTDKNQPRVELALQHLQEISALCRQQGLKFYLIVPPVKSYLYYDWVERPFYPDSKMLDLLQDRATASGYVDVKRLFHQKLTEGYQDLYYPDDDHWNFPAAQMAAAELVRADQSAGP